MPIADIAAVVGIAGGLNSLFGGGQQGQQYMPYQFGQMQEQLANQAQGLFGQQQSNLGQLAQIAPYLQQVFAQQQALPYQNLQAAAQQASGMYPGIAQQQGNVAQQLGGLAQGNFAEQQNLLGAGQNLYTAATDPRQGYYDRAIQQLQNQAGAAATQAGVASSPYGASVTANALGNFNLDFANQQLQRQQTGLQGLEQAGAAGLQQQQAGGRDLAQMLALLQAQPGTLVQGASLPVQTGLSIGQGQNQAAQGLTAGVGGVNSAEQQLYAQLANMLGLGQSASQTGFNQFDVNRQFQAGQTQGASAGLGNALGWLGQPASQNQGPSNWSNLQNKVGGWFSGGGGQGSSDFGGAGFGGSGGWAP